jgi:hypothetical protein
MLGVVMMIVFEGEGGNLRADDGANHEEDKYSPPPEIIPPGHLYLSIPENKKRA